MNYLKFTKDDMLNGRGVRLTLWVAGCNHECPKCQNPETWDPTTGQIFTKEMQNDFINKCNNNFLLKGITISGGDPLYIYKEEVLDFLKIFKQHAPHLNVWLYTGYTMTINKLKELENLVDVVVDGEFILDQRDITLKYRGSPNQRIINVKESLKNNEITEEQF